MAVQCSGPARSETSCAIHLPHRGHDNQLVRRISYYLNNGSLLLSLNTPGQVLGSILLPPIGKLPGRMLCRVVVRLSCIEGQGFNVGPVIKL
ncbi:hypothetical protein J6590_063321 [Homalodisca vitripennis]|nr:hypothetical protein J6590_063321 [Homalodisca vitripennis]